MERVWQRYAKAVVASAKLCKAMTQLCKSYVKAMHKLCMMQTGDGINDDEPNQTYCKAMQSYDKAM
jgi:hypothetical protein